MGDGELTRLVEVLRDLDQRRLTTDAAAQLLGLERRQVKGPVDPRMLNVRNRASA